MRVNFDTIRYHLTGPWAIVCYVLILILWLTDTNADPYIELKNKIKQHKEPMHQLGLGYEYKWYSNGKLYIEGGVRTEGYSTEFGYKYKWDRFTLKGKVESSKINNWNHVIETKLRYSF